MARRAVMGDRDVGQFRRQVKRVGRLGVKPEASRGQAQTVRIARSDKWRTVEQMWDIAKLSAGTVNSAARKRRFATLARPGNSPYGRLPRDRRDICTLATTSPEDGHAKLALAQEVIVSAGNILVAAGFQRDEIAAFFRQAADQLGGAAGPERFTQPPRDDLRAQPARTASPAGSISEIATEFAWIAPVRALADIAAGPDLAAALRGGEPPRPHIAMALTILPHIAEAQNWLRDMARDAGFEVVTNRQQWFAKATPEMLAQAGQTVFLDDFEAAYKPCFDFVTALVAAVVRENDAEALNGLLQGLVGCGIIVTHELKVELETAVETLIPMNIDAA